MTSDPSAALDALLTQAQAALGGTLPPTPEGPFVGEAADGLISAEVTIDGRLAGLQLDPTLARRPLADIAAEVVTAVNAALDARPVRPDTGPILAELKAVQEQSVHQMSMISAAFTEALARAARS